MEGMAPAKRHVPPDRTVKLLATGIRDRRLVKKLSQAELAELCDLHPTYVSVIERGLKSPTIFTLSKIAQALDLNTSELMANSGL
jgi:transcriptional regulator with XRE-family HTH domain